MKLLSRCVLIILSGFAAASLVSCRAAPRQAPALLEGGQADRVPQQIRHCLARLGAEGERNAVLNLSETAFQSVEAWDQIAPDLRPILVDQALDEAIRRIETVYADTPEARRARSVWHDEDAKDFKGEPYERCLVYLLRGLRYYQEGEFENARACFTSGLLQDSLSTEGEHDADMGTFEYLICLCDTRLGDGEAASEAWERAVKLWERSGTAVRPIGANRRHSAEIDGAEDRSPGGVRRPLASDNLLVVAFVGEGPRKSAIGKDLEVLFIGRGQVQTARVGIAAPWFGEPPEYDPAVQTDDIGFQATTRGGRLVDEFNKKKASTKHATENTGTVMTTLGKTAVKLAPLIAQMAASYVPGGAAADAFLVGGASTLAGGVGAQAIGEGITYTSKKMKTNADTRMIGSLPGYIHLWSGRVVPGQQLIAVKHYDRGGYCIGEAYKDVAVPYSRGNALAFLRCP